MPDSLSELQQRLENLYRRETALNQDMRRILAQSDELAAEIDATAPTPGQCGPEQYVERESVCLHSSARTKQ